MSSIAKLRQQFPILNVHDNRDEDWIYFDNAATTHKPDEVIQSAYEFYTRQNSNVHRGSYRIAQTTTQAYEAVRDKVAGFINARHSGEIVFTKGTTDGVNLLAHCLAEKGLKAGSNIVLTALEHHANIVPWQQVAKKYQLGIKVIPCDRQGILELSDLEQIVNAETAVVSVGQVSNAFGNINPLDDILWRARQVGAVSIVDGAQAVSHVKVDVQQLDCDFYLFSGHKMYGPTGIGVLYGQYDLLNALPPYQTGGEMIKRVSFSGTTFQPAPLKFEPGTPNIQGVLGLGAAIDWLQKINHAQWMHHEQQLYLALYAALKTISGIRFWGEVQHSVPILSFTIDGLQSQDVGIMLSEQQIAVRVGHHCAQPAMQMLEIDGTIRVSLAIYNQPDDIERFMVALKSAIHQLQFPAEETQLPAEIDGQSDKTIAQQIKQANSWEQQLRQIMLAGKTLQRLATEHKTPQNEVSGCESQVWLQSVKQGDKFEFCADASSKIVRGLLAILFEALNNKTALQIQVFDLADYLHQLGLSGHLSSSRTNGLNAVVQRIRQLIV